MLMPSIFGENLFDDFFNEFPFYYDDKAMKDTEKKLYGKRASHVMKTDIKEMENGYELVVDLPGFTKDEIKAYTKKLIDDFGTTKGLILGADCTIPADINPDHIRWVIEAAEEYGSGNK